MENNTPSQNPLAETAKTMATVSNSNGEPVAEEIVIYDECGDTLWDKVLAQTNTLEKLKKEITAERQ